MKKLRNYSLWSLALACGSALFAGALEVAAAKLVADTAEYKIWYHKQDALPLAPRSVVLKKDDEGSLRVAGKPLGSLKGALPKGVLFNVQGDASFVVQVAVNKGTPATACAQIYGSWDVLPDEVLEYVETLVSEKPSRLGTVLKGVSFVGVLGTVGAVIVHRRRALQQTAQNPVGDGAPVIEDPCAEIKQLLRNGFGQERVAHVEQLTGWRNVPTTSDIVLFSRPLNALFLNNIAAAVRNGGQAVLDFFRSKRVIIVTGENSAWMMNGSILHSQQLLGSFIAVNPANREFTLYTTTGQIVPAFQNAPLERLVEAVNAI